jgi:hypothetical protein
LFQKGTSAADIYKALVKAPKFKVALEVAGLTQPCENVAEVIPISKIIVVAPKLNIAGSVTNNSPVSPNKSMSPPN